MIETSTVLAVFEPSPARGGLYGDGFIGNLQPHPHPDLPLEGEGAQPAFLLQSRKWMVSPK